MAPQEPLRNEIHKQEDTPLSRPLLRVNNPAPVINE
jgi:hypothetical protein